MIIYVVPFLRKMSNPTQLDRYKKLLSYIENHFKEDINIEKVEDICHYSYRNINRIFQAIHGETIGKYVKRLRLEKAAQYLKYSETEVSDIAVEVGFQDRAAFSKAFKKRYHISPSEYRNNSELTLEVLQKSLLLEKGNDRQPLQFDIEHLPQFESLFVEYRGSYDDTSAIEKTWNDLVQFAVKYNLIDDSSPIMTELVDDMEFSDQIHSRYHFSLILKEPFQPPKDSLFQVKSHTPQKYAKFVFQGSDEESIDFYKEIYAFWMMDVGLELIDRPMLEFYPNYDENLPKEELITEIYIPVK